MSVPVMGILLVCILVSWASIPYVWRVYREDRRRHHAAENEAKVHSWHAEREKKL